MGVQITVPQAEVERFCENWQIVQLALFGSVLREDFRENSDIDVLVRFRPEARHTLFDIVTMQEGLKQILGRETDLVEHTAVEQSRNYIRRKAILDSAEVIYAA